jgi:hypothetical protein
LLEEAPRRAAGSIKYDEADGIFIQHYLKEKCESIGVCLLGMSVPGIKELWDVLCAKVVDTGNVVSRPRPNTDQQTTEQLLAAHFRRYKNHDKVNVNKIFFELETMGVDTSLSPTL